MKSRPTSSVPIRASESPSTGARAPTQTPGDTRGWELGVLRETWDTEKSEQSESSWERMKTSPNSVLPVTVRQREHLQGGTRRRVGRGHHPGLGRAHDSLDKSLTEQRLQEAGAWQHPEHMDDIQTVNVNLTQKIWKLQHQVCVGTIHVHWKIFFALSLILLLTISQKMFKSRWGGLTECVVFTWLLWFLTDPESHTSARQHPGQETHWSLAVNKQKLIIKWNIWPN